MPVPRNKECLHRAVQAYGVAQGPKKLMVMEEEAAIMAIKSGVYATWRSRKGGGDCTRIGPRSLCFCGHPYSDHMTSTQRRKPCSHTKTGKSGSTTTRACGCEGFRFIPSRPEEVGDYWLTRRRGFNVNTWRCKCRCGHSHEEHDPKHLRCKLCSCFHFQSNFLCVSCDAHWEDHETVFETEQERRGLNLPVGNDFLPLAATPGIRQAVFASNRSTSSNSAHQRLWAQQGNTQGLSTTPASLEERLQAGEISVQDYQRLILEEEDAAPSKAGNPSDHCRQKTTQSMGQMMTRQPRRRNQAPERSVRLSSKSSGGTARGRIVNRWGKVEPRRHRK